MSNGNNSEVARQDLVDAFQGLFDQLNAAYWTATTIEAKDRIRGIADAIFEVLTELNRSDFESRDAEFQAVTEQVKAIVPRLEKLKKEIDQVIHAVKIAVDVAKAADKALDLAAKYFAL